ncbi:MAG: hypothetical protein WCI63_04435 [bacterium]
MNSNEINNNEGEGFHIRTGEEGVQKLGQERDELGQTNSTEKLREEELENLGFSRIGETNYFSIGEGGKGFIVEPAQEGYKFFIDFENTDPTDLIGVGIGKNFAGNFAFSVLIKEHHKTGEFKREFVISPGASTWHSSGPEAFSYDGGDIANLLEAGFEEDQNHPGVYTNGSQVFIFQEGKLSRCLNHTYKFSNLLTPYTKIVGVSDEPGNLRFLEKPINHKVLKLENEFMSFKLSPQYQGEIVNGSQILKRELKPEELHIVTPEPVKEESGFIVSGENTSVLIESLKTINGISISDLEESMRPHRLSKAGFLGPNDSLIDTLVKDNDYVLDQGLTHQEIASMLRYAVAIADGNYGAEFLYKEARLHVGEAQFRGFQDSPFEDGTRTDKVYWLMNQEDNQKISLSGLLPDMIEKYGFYEGEGTDFRVSPQVILQIFGLSSEFK